MLWTQSILCFIAWIGIGLSMRRYSQSIAQWVGGWTRSQRVLISTVGLLAAGALLAVGLYGVQQAGGLTNNGLKTWAWIIVFLLGTIFTIVQVVSATAMVTLMMEKSPSAETQPSEERSQ